MYIVCYINSCAIYYLSFLTLLCMHCTLAASKCWFISDRVQQRMRDPSSFINHLLMRWCWRRDLLWHVTTADYAEKEGEGAQQAGHNVSHRCWLLNGREWSRDMDTGFWLADYNVRVTSIHQRLRVTQCNECLVMCYLPWVRQADRNCLNHWSYDWIN